MKQRRAKLLGVGALIVAVACFGWFRSALSPRAPTGAFFVRYEKSTRLSSVLSHLEVRGVVRSPLASRLLAWLQRRPGLVQAGTYRVQGGQSVDQVLDSLERPVRQMVRIPETNWARRTANLLEQRGILRADQYLNLLHRPQDFRGLVSFPLPATSLEGYLYPDTYDLPPLLGARPVVERQLRNFDRRVWQGLGKPKNLRRLLTVASLVELESGRDDDRAKIAGVVENRLKKGMPLQIDAALLYGIQKWRRLTFKDYRNIDSPYNLYTHKGLPPGPICSPSIKSIQAAMHPASHNRLYYVAMPDGSSLFASTYQEHLKNIKRRKKALADIEARETSQ